MKAVKSAQDIYTRTENPFDDRRRKLEINCCLYSLCKRGTTY